MSGRDTLILCYVMLGGILVLGDIGFVWDNVMA